MKIAIPTAFSAALGRLVSAWLPESRSPIAVTAGPAFGEGSITSRLEAGEAFDLVFLPDAALQAHAGAGRVLPASIRPAFRAPVGVAVPAGSPLPDISTPEALRQILRGARRIACTSASSGQHLRNRVLLDLGIDAEVEGRLLLATQGDVTVELAAGRADVGVQLMCELLHREGVDAVGPLPNDLQSPVAVSVGVGSSSVKAAAARLFIDHLLSTASIPSLLAAGLTPRT